MPDSDLPEPTVDTSYYVAYGRRGQSDAEFLAAATGVSMNWKPNWAA